MRKTMLCLASFFPFSTGGAEYQTYLLAEEFKKMMNIVFLGIDSSGSHCNRIEKDGYVLYHIPKRHILRRVLGRYYILDYFKLMRLFQEIRPDFIYQRSGTAYTGIAAYYARKSGCKLLWHIASSSDVQPLKFSIGRKFPIDLIDKKMLEYGIRHADYIIGQAHYQNKLLKKNYGRECDLIMPNMHPAPRGKIRKSEQIIVIWVGNMKRLKQPDMFIRLAREFHYHKNVSFIMIGRPATGLYQKKLEANLNKFSNIVYLKEQKQDRVNRILAKSHVFVNTSIYEGFPNTFIQAWLREVPVVSLAIDPDDIIKDNRIGFHSRNFEQMVKDVDLLISDQNLREEMGKRAKEYAIKNFSLDNINRIIELIQA